MSKIFLWWEGLNKVQSFFSYFAIPSTVLIILQTVLTLFGFIENAGGADVDSTALGSGFTADDLPDGVDLSDFPDGFDIDGDGIPDIFPEDFSAEVSSSGDGGTKSLDGGISELITFRGIVAFFAAGGWLVIGLISVGISDFFSTVIGVSIGFIIMIILGISLRKLKKMDSYGNIDTKNALGLDGVVYLKIPGKLRGEGKINLTVQGRYSEFLAVTNWEEDIPTGEEIKVVATRKDGLLIVEPKKPQRKIREE